MMYSLKSQWGPAGDQINAIARINNGFEQKINNQVLLGVTGSGKTFTVANVIQRLDVPTLILAPNKTLAAQIYEEMKGFFPENHVEYFVSYYDYYQPEAYKPTTNTYIPKESQRNDKIDQLRHSATRALCENKDVVIVSSVSCIYSIGTVDSYKETVWTISLNQVYNKGEWYGKLMDMQYVEHMSSMNNHKRRGSFCEKHPHISGEHALNSEAETIYNGNKGGSTGKGTGARKNVNESVIFNTIRDNDELGEEEFIQFIIYPSHLENHKVLITIRHGRVMQIQEYKHKKLHQEYMYFTIYPNTHHVVKQEMIEQACVGIERELKEHLVTLRNVGKIEAAARLEERTYNDISLLKSTHTCPGVENYSSYFSERKNDLPNTLYEFFPEDFLCVVDESHIAVPQLKAMSHADRKRKQTLIEYGFRLPSCLENRPLTFEEWNIKRKQTLFVSATPGKFESEYDYKIEQIIRPTGLVDPMVEIHPTKDQLINALTEAKKAIANGTRVIMLTLTKKMAEKINEYILSLGMKSEYIHADIDTLARIKILQNLRKGIIDIVVGINLLREGIDIPECGLVVIFDADQEGYLRSQTSLIQMIGRAARNTFGKVICYADRVTKSMKAAIEETDRRRGIQLAHNKTHSIVPVTTNKEISQAFDMLLLPAEVNKFFELRTMSERMEYIEELEKEMRAHASGRDFEKAIKIKQAISTIKKTGLLAKRGDMSKKISTVAEETNGTSGDNTITQINDSIVVDIE